MFFLGLHEADRPGACSLFAVVFCRALIVHFDVCLCCLFQVVVALSLMFYCFVNCVEFVVFHVRYREAVRRGLLFGLTAEIINTSMIRRKRVMKSCVKKLPPHIALILWSPKCCCSIQLLEGKKQPHHRINNLNFPGFSMCVVVFLFFFNPEIDVSIKKLFL